MGQKLSQDEHYLNFQIKLPIKWLDISMWGIIIPLMRLAKTYSCCGDNNFKKQSTITCCSLSFRMIALTS